MGENIEKLNKVIFMTASGEEFCMYANEFSKIELTREPQYEDFLDKSYISNEFSVDFKVKNVSRKRFIKLVMSYGFQKNTATELANYCLRKYGYYNLLNFMLNDLSLIK